MHEPATGDAVMVIAIVVAALLLCGALMYWAICTALKS